MAVLTLVARATPLSTLPPLPSGASLALPWLPPRPSRPVPAPPPGSDPARILRIGRSH
ncbi:MAG: hypothetical protein U1F51_11075 [Burkholderiales bacterium]